MACIERNDTEGPGAIMVVAATLMAVGLVMVTSTSASIDRSLLAPGLLGTVPGRHAIFVLAGFALILITAKLAARVLASPVMRRRIVHAFFAIIIVCLVAILIPGLGDAHRGSHRWLRLPLGGTGIGFQPSEFAKLAMVALLALLLTDRDVEPRSFRRCFLPASLAIGLCVFLVGKEDFGTSVLLAGVGATMLFVAGCRLRHLACLGVLGACGLTVLLFAAPYRLSRLTAYADFWSDPRGAGYQPLQSLTTIASGGWFGTGLGAGVQKYGYLPECQSDFIFAVICEEMGMFGAGLVIALYCAFIWLGLRIMLSAPTRFERVLAFGLSATLGLQAAMNIAVVTAVTPTTGISLPLVSAGGSGLFTFCLATGVLAAIALRARDVAAADAGGAVRRAGGVFRRKEATAW